ncbi:MAG: cyclase family protein [Deltaproteobacteria bacterium]|jgi:kynurenine formamidase|nr:cyclase family protein [Deltaproteobacteria bacterium]
MSKRWTIRPKGSTWGDWGEHDQLGRLNLIGPEQVRKAASVVSEGRTFCLSLPLDYPGGNVLSPVRFPPVLRPVIRNEVPYYNYEWRDFDSRLTDIASDDSVVLYTQYSTQWDSLAHRGSLFDANGSGESKPVYYNGFRAGADVTMSEEQAVFAGSLGIENMAFHCVQGRGVLIDLYSHFGEFPRKEVGYEDLMKVMDADGVIVEPGDILCLWTGLDRMIMRMEGHPDSSLHNACAVLDGWDSRLLQWISESGVAAIASDNLAVEATRKPIPDGYHGSSLPLHEHCLFKLGVHLGELWYFAELAEWLRNNGRSRFLLTAPPLRLTGAVGSPVTPVATV